MSSSRVNVLIGQECPISDASRLLPVEEMLLLTPTLAAEKPECDLLLGPLLQTVMNNCDCNRLRCGVGAVA